MAFGKLGSRVAVAVVGIPLLLASALIGKLFYLLLVSAVLVLAQIEFYRLFRHKGVRPISYLGIVVALGGLWGYYFSLPLAWFGVIVAFALMAMLIELLRNVENALLNVSATLAGVVYPAALIAHLVFIREMPKALHLDYAVAGGWIVLLYLCVWVCDTAAYFAGSTLGRHKLFPRVSPNKTVEGAVAGLVGAVLIAWAAQATFVQGISLTQAVVIGGVAGIIGQLGDLVESLFKRDVGVKDSSSILPGHGGLLDRFDSLIFVAPVAFWFLKFSLV